MLNLLIIDKDVNYSRFLLNYISQKTSQIRVYSIVDSLSEAIEILNTGLIDIAVIKLDDSIDSIYCELSKILNCYIEKYKKSFILLGSFNKASSNHYIYESISSVQDIEEIFLKIVEVAQNKMSQLNNLILLNKINKELKHIGYNLSYNGTKYLSESIALIHNNSKYGENLNKNIYPIIAKKYNKSINNIKCNITSATNCMFYECDEKRLIKYFNLYTPSKPSPKVVIYTVLSKLSK